MDLLTEEEFDRCRDTAEAVRKGRKRAWENYRAAGVTGQLRDLSMNSIGDSVLFKGYTRSAQLSPMIAPVASDEGCQFRCNVERSLVDGSIIGVRVTLVAFTR
jgi:hypothetical protein